MKLHILFFYSFLLLFCFNTNKATALSKRIEITSPTLNKKQLEKQLGRKLSFKEKLFFPLLKRKIKKGYMDKRTRTIAFFLCLFLGIFGIHRFYLGYPTLAEWYACTLAFFGIAWFIDFILLVFTRRGIPPN